MSLSLSLTFSLFPSLFLQLTPDKCKWSCCGADFQQQKWIMLLCFLAAIYFFRHRSTFRRSNQAGKAAWLCISNYLGLFQGANLQRHSSRTCNNTVHLVSSVSLSSLVTMLQCKNCALYHNLRFFFYFAQTKKWVGKQTNKKTPNSRAITVKDNLSSSHYRFQRCSFAYTSTCFTYFTSPNKQLLDL